MKKLHLLKTMLLLCALIVGSSSVWAETVTFTAGTDKSDGTSITKNGITISFSSGVFNRDDNFRCYSGASMTISSTSGNMTSIAFVATSSNNMTKFTGKPDVGAWTKTDDMHWTWNGDASEINFGTTSGQCRITSIVVTYTPAASKTATTTTIDATGIKKDRKGGDAAGTLTASVTETEGGDAVAGAVVTWESSNKGVATINASGAVTLVAEGTTTITASYAGNSTYAKSSDTYELVVNDTRAAAGLSYAVSEQTIHVGQVHEAFSLSNSNKLAVAYSSNNTAVATVDPSTGAVTGVAEGSATITAAFAGDNNYKAGQASYTLNVDVNSALDPVGPINLPGRFVKVTSTEDITNGDYLIVYEAGNVAFNGALGTLDDTENTISISFASEGVITETVANKAAVFTIDVSAGTLKSASDKYIGVSSNSNGLKQTDNANTYMNAFSIDDDGNAVISAVFSESTMTMKYNSSSNQLRFRYYKSGQQDIQLYKYVEGVEENTFDVTVGAAGWRTIVTSANATLPSGITAYIVTNSTSNSAKLTEKTSLKANTPYLLEATPGTYTLTVTDNPEEPTNNLLQISNASTTNGVYVLGNVGGVGFYKWTGGLLGAGRVYLPAPDPEAREFLSFDFEGETTAISEVRGLKSDVRCEFYNLNGQRVAQPTKGLYIVNGKKVMFK